MVNGILLKESLSLLKLQGFTTPRLLLPEEHIIDLSDENENEQNTIDNNDKIVENIKEQNKIISNSQNRWNYSEGSFFELISKNAIQLDSRTRRNKGKTSKYTAYVAK